MKTHIITKDQLDSDNKYVGSVPLSLFYRHIEIAPNLGTVNFAGALSATGNIVAGLGSGINAGLGINAGWGINAGLGINAGWGIKAKLRVFAGLCSWRLPTEAEQTVTCHQFTGTLAFGKLVLTPSPKEKSQEQKDAEYIAEIMQAFQELGPSELRDAIEYGRKHPTP